jgi:hypothetical protein
MPAYGPSGAIVAAGIVVGAVVDAGMVVGAVVDAGMVVGAVVDAGIVVGAVVGAKLSDAAAGVSDTSRPPQATSIPRSAIASSVPWRMRRNLS